MNNTIMKNVHCYEIVYEDLSKQGYRMGTPHKQRDLFRVYLKCLKDAVSYVHDAGVIHVDLYPFKCHVEST